MVDKIGTRWRIWLGYAIGISTLAFACRYVGLNRDDFLAAIRAFEPWRLVATTALFSLHLWLNANAYERLTASVRSEMSPSAVRSAWLASLLAKYIPGGIWQLVGRGALLGRFGMTPKVATITGIAEQLLSLAWCALLALLLWAKIITLPWLMMSALLLACAAFAIVPMMGKRIFSAVATRELRQSIVLYGFAMLPYAAGYLVLLEPAATWQFLMALFTGTIAGVLAILAPGGLGVRESVVAVFTDGADGAHLLVGMTFARLLMFVVEAFASITAMMYLRKLRP